MMSTGVKVGLVLMWLCAAAGGVVAVFWGLVAGLVAGGALAALLG